MKIRLLAMAALGALGALVVGAPAGAQCPGQCPVPGTGSTLTECFVEWTGVTLNYKKVRCTDGDLSCDVDGVVNGMCSFQLSACLNNADPRFPDCTPSDVATFTLKQKPLTSKRYDPQVAALQAAVDALGLPTSASVCSAPQIVTVPLKVKGELFARGKKKIRQIATNTGGARDSDSIKFLCEASTLFPGPYARAKQITSPLETIKGQLGRSQVGDYLLVNDKIKVAILRPGRHAYNAIGTYGGNIIDADWHHPDGIDRDSFETLVPGINIENTAHYTSVTVLNDGTNGSPAMIRATGVDDLLDAINASSVVKGFTPPLPFPPAQDDTDLPITIQTDYSLAAGDSFVKIETTYLNTSGSVIPTFFGEYLNGSGEIELFQPAWGFGEPLVTDTCPAASQAVPCTSGTCDLCNFIGYSGENSAKGVSYGFIHAQNDTSTFATDGVAVPLFGRNVALTLIGAQGPNYFLQPSGSAGDSVTITSYFAVGDGSIGSIETIRNQIQGISTGTIAGTVTDANGPVEDADVVVLGTAWTNGPVRNVADHFRTTAGGRYSGTLPPGSYTLQANKDGRLAASPASAPVTITKGGTTTQDFSLPRPGRIRVVVTDQDGNPLAAKVQLVGFDPSPDPGNTDSVVILNVATGVYGDYTSNKDGLPFGIAGVLFAGRDGDTGEQEIEPGTYQVAVSHGPRYSGFTQNVTVTEGALSTVNAQIAEVVPTPGYISGDWHVHAINSADCEVTNEERVMTQLAEGMDFFTPSDHEIRIDFTQTIADLGVSDLIGTAHSAEITTFDYGHFNSWPVTIDNSLENHGSVDHGGSAPAGQDFPAYGNYNLTPAQIYAAAHADPMNNLIQINHMDSHFGSGRSGLGIDTGLTPPKSSVNPALRRLPGAPTDNLFDSGFDALEVWIGTNGRGGYVNDFFGTNLGDWVNLTNQGILRTGVSSSDTHQRLSTQINARSYVASSVTDPGQLAAQAETLAANVVEGRLTGTNGPFVTINAEATCASSGVETAGLGIGEPTLICDNEGITGGSVDLTITVNSPAWAKYDTVQLYVNSATQLWDNDATPATPMRYRALPDVVLTAPGDFTVDPVDDFPSIPGATHWTSTINHTLTGLTGDVWIMAVVKGTDGVSQPMFPFYPNSLASGGNNTLADLTDGNLGESGMLAVSYTNPLYVDVDGGGWTPPGVNVVP